MNHTPGPWVVTQNGPKTHPLAIESRHADYDGFDLAHCVHEHDARLIATAPELLAALRDFVGYFGPDVDNGLDEILTNARAAIARATA